MDDEQILKRIRELVAQEHEIRRADHEPVEGEPTARQLEETLDQCWDLLRQRRAREEFGENPDEAGTRDTRTVEGYRQ